MLQTKVGPKPDASTFEESDGDDDDLEEEMAMLQTKVGSKPDASTFEESDGDDDDDDDGKNHTKIPVFIVGEDGEGIDLGDFEDWELAEDGSDDGDSELLSVSAEGGLRRRCCGDRRRRCNMCRGGGHRRR